MCSKALGMYLEGTHSKEVTGFVFKRAAWLAKRLVGHLAHFFLIISMLLNERSQDLEKSQAVLPSKKILLCANFIICHKVRHPWDQWNMSPKLAPSPLTWCRLLESQNSLLNSSKPFSKASAGFSSRSPSPGASHFQCAHSWVVKLKAFLGAERDMRCADEAPWGPGPIPFSTTTF